MSFYFIQYRRSYFFQSLSQTAIIITCCFNFRMNLRIIRFSPVVFVKWFECSSHSSISSLRISFEFNQLGLLIKKHNLNYRILLLDLSLTSLTLGTKTRHNVAVEQNIMNIEIITNAASCWSRSTNERPAPMTHIITTL